MSNSTVEDDRQSYTADLRTRVQAALEELDLNQSDVAAAIGSSKTTFSKWIGGTYDRPTPKLEAKLETWLESLDEVLAADPEDGDDEAQFVETGSAVIINRILAYCHAKGDLGVIYGGPGVGKTTCAQQYQSLHSRVWIATACPDADRVQPLLQLVAAAVGASEPSSGKLALSLTIRKAVSRRRNGARGLLIIDEAQHLQLKSLESLRAIHDATGVGLVLMGNQTIYDRLTGGARSAEFAQLFSRIGLRRHMPYPKITDVNAIASASGVTDDRCLAMLQRISKQPGALRGVVKTIALAIGQAEDPSKVTAEDVRTAARNLGFEL